MSGSTIADDYDRYRLLDGEVVEAFGSGPSQTLVIPPGGNRKDDGMVYQTDRLTRPTRLHLQLAGDPNIPGGLLD